MRDVYLQKQLCKLIDARQNAVKSGRSYTADPEHNIITRSQTFTEYVNECASLAIKPFFEQEVISKWAMVDNDDLQGIPEQDRGAALEAMKQNATLLGRIGLQGYAMPVSVATENAPSDPGVSMSQQEQESPPPSNDDDLSAYIGYFDAPDGADADDDIDPKDDLNSAYSAYENSPQQRGGSKPWLDEDMFARVNGKVTFKQGLNGETHYFVDGAHGFTEFSNRIGVTKAGANNEEVLLAAVLVAAKKFDGVIKVNGNKKFVEDVLTVIAKNNLDVTFKKPKQAALYEQIVASLQAPVAETQKPLDDAAKKAPFHERMDDLAKYEAEVNTGSICAEKIESVEKQLEEPGVKKAVPGPVFH